MRPARGYHVARFCRGFRRGLISGPDLITVLQAAGTFTLATVIWDEQSGRYPVTTALRAGMSAAQLERIRRRDREATRRRRAIARGLPEPGPVSDLFVADRRLGLPEGLPVLGKWILRAACRDQDPELWFSAAPADAGKAQAICTGCPVRSQCSAASEASYQHQYELAIRHGQTHWVAGLLPFSVDGMIVSATLVLWYAAWHGHPRPWGA